jgi:hypothetical protein
MKLFAGLSKTDYQDVLRTIGLYADEMGLQSLRLVEVEDGIVIQCLQNKDGEGAVTETLLLTDDDLREMLMQAYKRRATSGTS